MLLKSPATGRRREKRSEHKTIREITDSNYKQKRSNFRVSNKMCVITSLAHCQTCNGILDASSVDCASTAHCNEHIKRTLQQSAHAKSYLGDAKTCPDLLYSIVIVDADEHGCKSGLKNVSGPGPFMVKEEKVRGKASKVQEDSLFRKVAGKIKSQVETKVAWGPQNHRDRRGSHDSTMPLISWKHK